MAVKSIELTSPPDTINEVHKLLLDIWDGAEQVNSGDRYRFELALIELATNVMQHADPGNVVRCTILVETSPERLSCTVYDSGPPVVLELEGRSMPDALEESGRGIPLIRALVDELDYGREGGVNRWYIMRRLEN